MAKVTARLFETGTITLNDGFNSIVSTPTIDTSSKMKGLNCARTNWSASANVNGVVSSLTAGEFWLQFYINVASYPAGATSRIVTASNGSTQWNLTMTTTGQLTLRNNSTNIATTFTTLSLNTTYRVGIHFKKESTFGALDGVIDIYTATGDTAFGSAAYSSSAYGMNVSASAISSIAFGQNNGASTAGDIYWDDIRIDDAVMPSTAGVLTDNLVAYWTLDETSGTRASQVNGHTLTDGNTVTSGTGIISNAGLWTRANSEYLSRADNSDLSAGNVNVTWGMWVKMVTKPAANASIIGKWNYSGGTREYTIGYDGTADRFYLQTSFDGTNTGATIVSANNLGSPSTGVWYFIVASHNAGADLLSISVNGGTADTASHTTGIFDSTSNFNIGAMNNGTDLFWDGYIDEVGIWKRILTSTEITFLYNSGSGKTYPFPATTDTPKSITLSVTSTLTFGPKAVGKPIAIAVTTTKSILRAISFIRLLIVTLAASVIKAKPLLVSLAVSSAATIQKTVGKPISVAVTSTINRLTAYSKIISRTVTSTVSATKGYAIQVTKAVTSTPTVLKNILKPIAVSVTASPIFLKGLVTLKTITYAVTSTINFTKGIVTIKNISYAVTSTVTFAKGMVNLKTVTLAVTSTVPTALKNVGKPILRTVTTTLVRITNIPHVVLVSVTAIKFLQKDFAFTKVKAITSTVTAVVGKGYFKTVTQLINVSSVIQKNILKPIVMTQTVVASVGPKSIAKTIARVITVTVSSIKGKLVLKAISYIATVSVNRNVSVGKVFLIVQNTTVTMQRSLTLLISRIVVASTLPSVQKNIQFTRTVIVNMGLAFSKLLANAFTNLYLRKNARSLTLSSKNTALEALGKNSRRIDLKDTNES